jgi:hypothetical protein
MAGLDIIICTYNRAAALDACLDALARQTAPRDAWTVLVIDNGSTDGTASVVERHAAADALPGLRYVREDRRGLTAARRRGIGEATAPFAAFVDDDCHLAPTGSRRPCGRPKGTPARPVSAAGSSPSGAPTRPRSCVGRDGSSRSSRTGATPPRARWSRSSERASSLIAPR